MGLFSRKDKKTKTINNKERTTDKELKEEELDKVTAGVPKNMDWCPRVNVNPREEGELTEEELDNVKAGMPIIEDEER